MTATELLERPGAADIAGKWRAVFWVSPRVTITTGLTHLGDNIWASNYPKPTRQEAEDEGAEATGHIRAAGFPWDAAIEFLEARFFPGARS